MGVPPVVTSSSIRAYMLSFAILIDILSTASSENAYPACKDNPAVGVIEVKDLEDEKCSFMCPTDINYVCGTDHHSYLNECYLCRMACIAPDRDVVKRCDGRCPCQDDEEWYKWQEAHRKAQEDAAEHKEEGWRKHKRDFPDVKLGVKTRDNEEL